MFRRLPLACSPESDPSAASSGAKPGDEAPPGTPGTGDNTCRACAGTGRKDGQPCPECRGTGVVNAGIGGA